MVPPSGTREKSPGPGSSFACRKPKCAPAPHRAREMRPHPAQISRLKRRGLRGNMVPPSNRARPAMRCRTAFPQKCRDWPPGAFSLGPLQRPVLFLREKRMGGWGRFPLGKKKTRPLGRIEKLGRAWRGIPHPARGRKAPVPAPCAGFLFPRGQQKSPCESKGFCWWTIQESNLLPPVRQTGALAK